MNTRLRSIMGGAAVLLFLLLFDFVSRADIHYPSDDLPRTAIVFTGAYDRIDLGLELLSSGRVDRLFITGANRTSGLIPTRFPELFDPNSEQANWIASERIVLAPDAHSTFENALEAACWLDSEPKIEEVALITSQRHMARASVALQQAIAPTSVVRVVSDPSNEYDKFQIDLIEFSKFTATWVITFLPSKLWPATEPTICLDG
ncbi:MAG: hypothetical protein GVY36_20315 [Verrucomicrobia bacterium]|jgi:uncharacterized SAM-binding protein YcdF (DUF218 family)|nr:hypothetical protein [Verrucomicrobiota bacterium]